MNTQALQAAVRRAEAAWREEEGTHTRPEVIALDVEWRPGTYGGLHCRVGVGR